MLDAHAHVMQVKLCKANTRGVTPMWPVEPQYRHRLLVRRMIVEF